jgi:hypothetical protein
MNGPLRETEGEGAVPSFERVNGRRQAFTLKLAGSLAAAGLAGGEPVGPGAGLQDVGVEGDAVRAIEGREQVARYALDVAGRAPNLTILERTVNGQPGLVEQQDGVTVTVVAFDVAGDRIKHIWAVRNPGKIRPWTTADARLHSFATNLRGPAQPLTFADAPASVIPIPNTTGNVPVTFAALSYAWTLRLTAQGDAVKRSSPGRTGLAHCDQSVGGRRLVG